MKTKWTIGKALFAAWVVISFYSVMIFAEAPLWLLILVIANFGACAYVSNKIKMPFDDKKEEMKDENN